MTGTGKIMVLSFYNFLWKIAIPFLKKNQRLSEGYAQRTLKKSLPPADIWLQSASGGEAYLAWSVIRRLETKKPLRILLTSNTRQGMEVIEKAIDDMSSQNANIKLYKAYFPFDQPDIMEKAVSSVNPSLMILMELEIWPGLLFTLKKRKIKTIILNGRLTEKSFKRYLSLPKLWNAICPDTIHAISNDDAGRFQKLFPKTKITITPNIKFDGIITPHLSEPEKNPLEKIFHPNTPSVVLGSVRKEEESEIEKIIVEIIDKKPHTVIGLIPRHMHRLAHWEKTLSRLNILWIKRSEINTPVNKGTVVLWDIFGELSLAYKYFKAAFVGGSLAPLGGQNFLEALDAGVKPVIGPSWENFSWVGEGIMDNNLLRIGQNWQEVAGLLINDLEDDKSRSQVMNEYQTYIKSKQGGSKSSCETILTEINAPF